MTEKRKSYPQITSPKLAFQFPKLNEPDYGTKEFPQPDGAYSVKARGDASDPAVQAFIRRLQPIYDRAMEEAKEAFSKLKPETRRKLKEVTENPFYTELLDKDTEEPTGEVEFKFSMKASGEFKKGPKTGKRWSKKPTVFDAKGQPLKVVPEMWSGTIGRISFEASDYFIPATGIGGLKLGLLAVQIVELRTGGQKSAKEHGFDVEEDGYEAGPTFPSEDEEENQGDYEPGDPGPDANPDF